MVRSVAIDPEMPLARAVVDFRFALSAAGRSPRTVSSVQLNPEDAVDTLPSSSP